MRPDVGLGLILASGTNGGGGLICTSSGKPLNIGRFFLQVQYSLVVAVLIILEAEL